MSISRVGTATGTTTWTVPAHAIGDIIVTFAFRTASATPPALAAGFTNIFTIVGTTSSARLSYRIATATNDAAGTSTNATATVGHVYRSSLISAGGSIAIGGSASTHAAASLTVNFPALTLTNAAGSWALGFAGVSNTSQTISTAPSGMTNESLETAAASQAAGFDTNGTVTSWSSTNATDTGTAGNTCSCTLELCENAAGSAIGNFVDHISTQSNVTASVNEALNLLVVEKPNPSLAGNTIVVTVAYPSGNTPLITDDKSNTWPVSGATGTVTADAGAGNMALQTFVLNAATTGTQAITVSFGSTVLQPVKMWITELSGVTGTIEGSATATAVNAAGVVSPGSFIPSTANCLVLSYLHDSNTSGATNPSLIRAANGYFLNDADISWNTGAGTPSASQAALQTTAVATAALFNLANGGTETYNALALALSTGAQGTPKPAGIHVDRVLFFSTNSTPASWPLQIPSTGNLGFMLTGSDLFGTGNLTAIDSDAVTWTNKGTIAGPIFLERDNQTPNPGRSVSINFTGHTAQNMMMRYYDISGAATAPFDLAAFLGATSTNNISSLSNAPIITPTTSNGLVIGLLFNGLGPTLGCTSPVGNTYIEPNYSTAKFVAGIAATTTTVASTTWGTVNAGPFALSGPGVTLGTTFQSCTCPKYLNKPSQTVTPCTTMLESSSDSSNINWGNGTAHYYNPNTSAIPFAWTFANQPSSSVVCGAIAFKAAPTSSAIAPLPIRQPQLLYFPP